MKIIDNNGRLFGKISVIDVIVILAVAVLAVALYQKTNTKAHTSTAVNDPIEYQVLVEGARTTLPENLRVGDKIFDEDNGSVGCLGEITAIEILPGEEQVTFQDGTVALIPTEDTVDILLSIRGEGLVDGKSYFLNRVYSLGVNSCRNFCTPYVRCTGTVVSIG